MLLFRGEQLRLVWKEMIWTMTGDLHAPVWSQNRAGAVMSYCVWHYQVILCAARIAASEVRGRYYPMYCWPF